MTFAVTYRGKDGALREDAIEAASRSECLSVCKAHGIVPVAIREGHASSRSRSGKIIGGRRDRRQVPNGRRRVPIPVVVGALGVMVLLAIGAWWLLGSRGEKVIPASSQPIREKKTDEPRKDDQPRSTSRGAKGEAFVVPELSTAGNAQARKAGMERPAKPEARAQLRGTEARIERAKARGDRRIFVHDSECYLSNFAIPGEQVPPTPFEQDMVDDLMKALDEPINIDMSEDSETDIQMKNIVQGMKDEIKEYLKNGGTIETYLAELQKRQDREANYYSEAFAMVNKSAKEDDPAMAYELWKKTNEHLQSQGIRTMPLPRRLRNYERNL